MPPSFGSQCLTCSNSNLRSFQQTEYAGHYTPWTRVFWQVIHRAVRFARLDHEQFFYHGNLFFVHCKMDRVEPKTTIPRPRPLQKEKGSVGRTNRLGRFSLEGIWDIWRLCAGRVSTDSFRRCIMALVLQPDTRARQLGQAGDCLDQNTGPGGC